jgi:DegV family protein with EDD domain
VNSGTNIAVVCDTTAYLPAEMIETRGIERVSLYVALGGEQRRESQIADYDSFFERLRASDEGATTSQPSVGDFIEVYAPLLEAGRDIVSIHLSATISGTYEAALQARQRLIDDGQGGERIHVMDSRTAAGGMGMLVLAASAAAAAGESPEAVIARTRETREQLRMWFAIDTLEYLKRGGRIGGVSAWVGSTLKIKPILTVESEITPVERVRTSARAFERLVDYARQRHASKADGWVVQHAQSAAQAELLVGRGREIFGREPLFVSEVGPVIGAHTGPGLLGIGSMPERYLV